MTRPATAPTGSSERGALPRDLSPGREQFSVPPDAPPSPLSPGGASTFRQGSLSSQPDLLAIARGDGGQQQGCWANTLPPRGRPDVLGPALDATRPAKWLCSTLGRREPDGQHHHHLLCGAQPAGWEQTWL